MLSSTAVVIEPDSGLQVGPGGPKVVMVCGGGRRSGWRVEDKYTMVCAWPAYADSPELHVISIVD